MRKTTRGKIFALEIFEPSSNIGYGINAMLMHSNEIAEMPYEELVNELDKMEAEGLIDLEEGYYRSTIQGQIENQKYLARIGALQYPLANHAKYVTDDLLIAISASHRVDPLYGSDFIRRNSFEIYLHSFKSDEVHAALERLISAKLIANYEFPEGSIHITGIGFQRYLTEVRQLLQLPRDIGILSPLLPLPEDDRFDNLGIDAQLCKNLKNRWKEMEACAMSSAYLASIILLGSILEGLLLAKLQSDIKKAMTSTKAPKDKKTSSTKPIGEWTLQEYITVAIEIGLAPSSVEKHLHELRDSRNLVHPNKQITNGICADEHLYRISREITETIIDSMVVT
jgi:hypothetical protein